MADPETGGCVYDFGGGPIPAHRHANGGGWVADSARVGDESRVGDGASVGNRAIVGDEASVGDEAIVGNSARVGNRASVGNSASVGAGAIVGNRASVGDRARVGDWAKIVASMTICPIGSRQETLSMFLGDKGELYAQTGCFWGSMSEFEAAVKKTHGDNEHGRAYAAAIRAARAMWPAKAKRRKTKWARALWRSP